MYIASGSSVRAPSSKATRGRGRGDDEVEALEGLGEVLGDLGPHLLGAPVVGLVVAGGERVGAEHDPALHLGPEAVVARALVHLGQVVAVGAQADSGRRRSGPGSPRPRPARSRSRPRSRAARAAARSRRPRRRAPRSARRCARRSRAPRPRSPRPRPASSLRNAEAEPLQVLAARAARRRPRSRPRSSRRGRVPPAPQQQRGVGDVAGQRPALVERGGEGDHPVARDRRRRWASGRRSRRATRAGGSSRRCRCRSRRAPGAPRPPPPSRPRSRPGRGRCPRGCSTAP